MSNLLKKGTTVSRDERIIDYNELIKNKIDTIIAEQNSSEPGGNDFVSGLKADVVEQLLSDDETAMGLDEQLENADGKGTASAKNEENISAALEEANKKANHIISDAKNMADGIVDEAKQKAEIILKEAKADGLKQAEEISNSQLDEKLNQLEQEYNNKKASLEEEYLDKKKKIEPELVDVLTEVFRKVTNTIADDNKEIILYLIESALRNCELSKSFLIKVSPDDFKFVSSNQGKILCSMKDNVQIDVVEDTCMKKNECIIESDGGIFNCSLDIELNNLIKQIKLLSCL